MRLVFPWMLCYGSTPKKSISYFRTFSTVKEKFSIKKGSSKPLPGSLNRNMMKIRDASKTPQNTGSNRLVTVSTGDSMPNPVTAPKVSPFEVPDQGFLPFGILNQLPQVPLAEELKATCITRAKSLKIAKYVTGSKEKHRDLCMRKLNVVTEYSLYRLDKCIHSVPPKLERMHPFERTVVGLTLGPTNSPFDAAQSRENIDDEIEELVPTAAVSSRATQVFGGHTTSGEAHFYRVMRGLRKLRNRVQSAYEQHAKRLQQCQTQAQVEETFACGSAALLDALSNAMAAEALSAARTMFDTLRRLNTINPRLPTVALVGAPNVGKSSLVRVLSSGKPEVQNYPFTTKHISCGHVAVESAHGAHLCQVTDTPGLLNRPDHERKRMEMLTLAVLEHLPRLVVIFVIDPSAHCGTSVEDQLSIRQELRWRYHKLVPGHRWFDVATKTDIWKQTPAEVEAATARAEHELEEAMIRVQARRLGVSEQRVRAELAAVDRMHEENARVSVTWRQQALRARELLETHGDWVVDRELGEVLDGEGERIMSIDELLARGDALLEEALDAPAAEATHASEDASLSTCEPLESDAEYIDCTERAESAESERAREPQVTLTHDVDVVDMAVSGGDGDGDGGGDGDGDGGGDGDGDGDGFDTSVRVDLAHARAAVSGPPPVVAGKPRKATLTATPDAPSSLAVAHTWRLQSAIADLPARPRHFVDDDCRAYEVSVINEDSFRETLEAQRALRETELQRMFGVEDAVDTAIPNPTGHTHASHRVDGRARARVKRKGAPMTHARAQQPTGMGLQEVHVDINRFLREEDARASSLASAASPSPSTLAAACVASPALKHGVAGLEDMQGALAWELVQLCEDLDEQDATANPAEALAALRRVQP